MHVKCKLSSPNINISNKALQAAISPSFPHVTDKPFLRNCLKESKVHMLPSPILWIYAKSRGIIFECLALGTDAQSVWWNGWHSNPSWVESRQKCDTETQTETQHSEKDAERPAFTQAHSITKTCGMGIVPHAVTEGDYTTEVQETVPHGSGLCTAPIKEGEEESNWDTEGQKTSPLMKGRMFIVSSLLLHGLSFLRKGTGVGG